MKTPVIKNSSACFTWRIHQHHGWKTIHSSYCDTRAEFDAECDRLAEDAASNSDNSPSLFNRDEYLECDYHTVPLKTDAVAVVACSKNDVQQFTNEAEAQAAHAKALREHGYARLLCDIGGHAGPTNIVDVEDITIHLLVNGRIASFTAPDAAHKFTEDEIEDSLGEGENAAQIAAMLNEQVRKYA